MHWINLKEDRANIHLQHSFYKEKRFIFERGKETSLQHVYKHRAYEKLEYIARLFTKHWGM